MPTVAKKLARHIADFDDTQLIDIFKKVERLKYKKVKTLKAIEIIIDEDIPSISIEKNGSDHKQRLKEIATRLRGQKLGYGQIANLLKSNYDLYNRRTKKEYSRSYIKKILINNQEEDKQ